MLILDMMNVTNIIMNFEQNKNPVISYVVNVLEDLKKQIVSIQYYSLLQKLFISYIFKNLESFSEQVNNNPMSEPSKQDPNKKVMLDELNKFEMLKQLKPNMPTNMGGNPLQNSGGKQQGGPTVGPNMMAGLSGMGGNPLIDQMLKGRMNPSMMGMPNPQQPGMGGLNPLLMGMNPLLGNPLSMMAAAGGNGGFNPLQVMQSLGQQNMNPLQNPLINPQLLQLLAQNGINPQMMQQQGENKMMNQNPSLLSMLQGSGGRDPNQMMNMMQK
jgi:hypothetical protein